MSEPLYSYVKGSGWVPVTNVVTMYCGALVRLEMRFPENDEYWNGAFSDAYAELSHWISRAPHTCFRHLSNHSFDKNYYRHVCVYTRV